MTQPDQQASTSTAPSSMAMTGWTAALAMMTLVVLTLGLGYWLRGDGPSGDPTPAWAIPFHLATVLPAVPLGAWLLWRPKGTSAHRLAGRLWVVLMLLTALSSFWVRRLTGGLEPIHLLSILTLIAIPWGVFAARKGDIATHRVAMRSVYVGLVVAGLFTLLPNRMIGAWLFG